ncbi:hypothetical protein FACS1894147_11180 [Spirochaetia bacterium]|nr:hypothetical protein FACS1894147_11180 [Spirochaetia bacterium]
MIKKQFWICAALALIGVLTACELGGGLLPPVKPPKTAGAIRLVGLPNASQTVRIVDVDYDTVDTYQWLKVKGGKDEVIPGVTGNTLTLSVFDIGSQIKARVTLKDGAGVITSPEITVKAPVTRELLASVYPDSGSASGIAVDSSGNIYVVAQWRENRIVKVSPNGATVTAFAGPSAYNGSDDWGTYAEGALGTARFAAPMGLAIDAADVLYVADKDTARIRKVSTAGVVSTLAGTGTQGHTDGAVASAEFHKPKRVAVDPSGNVYVGRDEGAPTNGVYVSKIDVSAGQKAFLAGSTSQQLTEAESQAGTYVTGSGASVRFKTINSIVADSSGNLLVADAEGRRIRKINTATGATTSFVGDGNGTNKDGNGEQATMNGPSQMAFGRNGILYVTVEWANDPERLRGVTPEGDTFTVSFSDGVSMPAGNAMTSDSDGNLYVLVNGRDIYKITIPR